VSSYDPPHRPWRRRSKGGSRRSSLASHPPSRRRQQRKRRPRRLTGIRHHPPRLRPMCLWRCRHPPPPPHPPRQRPQQQQSLPRRQRRPHLSQRRHRLRRPRPSHRDPNHRDPSQRDPSQLVPSQRQFRVPVCLELPDRPLRQPLEVASNRLPPRGHVPVLPADFLALRADGDLAPRDPETTPLRPHKEWVGHVRPVRLQTAPDLLVRGRPQAALRSRAVARASRACRGLTPR
jgi:hypothetical protein